MTKAVIFDFDGVIVQTADIRFEGVKKALERHGYKIDGSSLNYFIGKTRKEFINKFVVGIPPKEVDQIIEESNQICFEKIPTLEPINGVEELIDKLNKEFVLAIASTSKRNFIEAVLNHLGLSNKFKTIASADDVINKKPNPEIYLKVLEKLNFSNQECVTIEDSTTGIESAKRAGVRCIALKHENYPQDLSRADLVVDKLQEITIDVITKLNG